MTESKKCPRFLGGACSVYAGLGKRSEGGLIVYPTNEDLRKCQEGFEGCNVYATQ